MGLEIRKNVTHTVTHDLLLQSCSGDYACVSEQAVVIHSLEASGHRRAVYGQEQGQMTLGLRRFRKSHLTEHTLSVAERGDKSCDIGASRTAEL